MFRLEDISKNLTGYGNYGNFGMQNGFINPNGLTISTEIGNLHLWCDDSSNETENYILKNRTVHR